MLQAVAAWLDGKEVLSTMILRTRRRSRISAVCPLAFAAMLACASACGTDAARQEAGAGTDGAEGPPAPSGPDGVVPLATLGVGKGSLYNDIAVAGGLVYACTAAEGLRVVRQDGWEALEKVADLAFDDAPGCRSLSVSPEGDVFAAGLGSSDDSWVAAIAGGDTPSVRHELNVGAGIVEGLAATESHVFVAMGTDGIVVLGNNDGHLAEVSRLESGFEQALGLAVWDQRLVVANGTAGLVLVDVSAPESPSIERSFDTVGSARRVVMRDGLAYVATVTAGVAVHDPAATSPGAHLALWVTHGSAVDVAVSEGGAVFVANMEDLCILDASTPEDMSLVLTERPTTPTGGTPRLVAVEHSGGVTYAAEWSSLWSFVHAQDKTAPDIWLHRTAVDLGMVTQSKKGKGVIVRNLGTATLEVSEATVEHPAFGIEVDPTSIPAGGNGFLQITFEKQNDDEVKTQARLLTNDPDEAEVLIPITANSKDRLAEGSPFDPDGQLEYAEYATGQPVTVKGKYAGKVVILAYFGSS